MSFLDKIFGSSEKENNVVEFWNKIESEADLDEVIRKSFQKKVAIFKHSTRCFISKTVMRKFEKEVERSDKDVEYYYLDLLAHRDISNKIADQLGVEHQSPQLIVLENGTVVRSASHHSINLDLV
ncbi:bacillithiol system redox-active protein YtxJ [Chryseobacterium koreense]|uniref:General stress protein n=1 Tax=Chryseobacterium koreense CCUG 49689 TaxID=1304281 RepID=A0A0J7J3U2_9FLAO|nr:bacillithiol system redox-active protein YtxJ [Chryseobacterium koreense]KMQ72601.1 general stress protein [Chryseobacterium koreense CCUG 49689]MBB5332988.1 bacillithiol system protein YtxJ [Chryseobacterium koreense]